MSSLNEQFGNQDYTAPQDSGHGQDPSPETTQMDNSRMPGSNDQSVNLNKPVSDHTMDLPMVGAPPVIGNLPIASNRPHLSIDHCHPHSIFDLPGSVIPSGAWKRIIDLQPSSGLKRLMDLISSKTETQLNPDSLVGRVVLPTETLWCFDIRFIVSEQIWTPPCALYTIYEALDELRIPHPRLLEERGETTPPWSCVVKDLSTRNIRQLSNLWPKLPMHRKRQIAKETALHINRLRGATHDSMYSLTSDNLDYRGSKGPLPTGISRDDDAMFDALCGKLGVLSGDARASLREKFPPCQPYTLTHGFVGLTTIWITNDDNVIIDGWDYYTGYFPVWWECALNCSAGTSGNQEWRELLLDGGLILHRQGLDFWDFYCQYSETKLLV